jgi:hypothetical protein
VTAAGVAMNRTPRARPIVASMTTTVFRGWSASWEILQRWYSPLFPLLGIAFFPAGNSASLSADFQTFGSESYCAPFVCRQAAIPRFRMHTRTLWSTHAYKEVGCFRVTKNSCVLLIVVLRALLLGNYYFVFWLLATTTSYLAIATYTVVYSYTVIRWCIASSVLLGLATTSLLLDSEIRNSSRGFPI